MIFGEKLADRLMKKHYQEQCLKMTRLSLDVKEQKQALKRLEDEWKDIKKQIKDEPLNYWNTI